MHYEGTVIRPPSEANSIILQVTRGCSHNKCTFCGTYKGVLFALKPWPTIDQDIEFAARYCRRQQRIFLADGDVLILPQSILVRLLERIREKLPWVNRVSLYGNARSIRAKTDDQLRELKALGLDRVYMGLESGDDQVLLNIRKGADAAAMVQAGRRVRTAGLFLSVTVLLGIAGKAGSISHARATGNVLTDMAPNQIGVLTLMVLPNTALYQEQKAGRFSLPDENMLLRELRAMIENIHLDRVQFQANHASNYLPINVRLGKDKPAVLDFIDQALAGAVNLVPEQFRAL